MIEADEPGPVGPNGDPGVEPRAEALADPGAEALAGALPGERARAFYLTVLGEGGRIRMADIGPADTAAVAELVDLGLLVADPARASHTAVNPRSVGGRLSEELRSAGTRLLVQAQQMPALLEDLTQAYDLTPRKVDRSGEVRHVRGAEEIRRRVRQLADDCKEEVLAARSGTGRGIVTLDGLGERTRRFIGDGGSIRVLLEPAARTEIPAVGHVAQAAAAGARFRVLGESFKRMFIFDRATVVIPSVTDGDSAAFVEDPAVLAFLVGTFERDWQRAEPVRWSPAADPAGLPVHAQVGRMLSQGLTQRTIATRLGLSERTVAAQIARLRELYDAETLFQLGWLMRALDGDGKGEPNR